MLEGLLARNSAKPKIPFIAKDNQHKTVKLANLATCDPNLYTPRTNNVQIVDMATCELDYGISDDSPLEKVSGASLDLVDNPELRERMKELLERILKYCELSIKDEADAELGVSEEINL